MDEWGVVHIVPGVDDVANGMAVVAACHNSAGTIRTAIESVLSQKGVDVEYIVVDGGLADGQKTCLKV